MHGVEVDQNLILGCDAATNHTGLVWFDRTSETIIDSRLLVPNSNGWQSHIREIGIDFKLLIMKYPVQIVIIEEPDMQGMVGRTTGVMAKLMGITYYLAGICSGLEIPFKAVPVQTWKGSVPKHIIRNRLMEEYNDVRSWTVEDDRVDALGLAIYYHKSGLRPPPRSI